MRLARRGGDGAEAARPAMLERFSAQMLATARRYSATLDDADDAYQRAAEILLTRGPAASGEEMGGWLRTTVKHEALAIRRQRDRTVPFGAPELVPEPPCGEPDTHERAERFERLRLGAQALRRLKPHEVRCLVLKAQGYTYNEICDLTGFSYTKVDRCLKEGRRAFVERLAGIESGAECERLAPLLSALADGEASAEDLAALRPHLKTCLSCRALLRKYRDAPSRVAALVPPAALAASGGDGGPVRALLESVLGAAQDRAAVLGERAHQATEMAVGQKVAAVAASAAALVGGGVGVEKLSERAGDGAVAAARAAPAPNEVANEAAPVLAPPSSPAAAPTPAPPPPPAGADAPAPKPSPTNEFAPEAAAAAPRPAAAAASGEFSPGGGGGSPGEGEFGP